LGQRRLHGAQVPLLIWEGAIPFIDPVAEECGLLGLPHLTGTAQVTQSDNDLFTTGNRAEAAQALVRGQAASEAGERFTLGTSSSSQLASKLRMRSAIPSKPESD
jgi:hypothetical protein